MVNAATNPALQTHTCLPSAVLCHARATPVCACPQCSDDDDEQMDVTSRAQVLMDCMADMVGHHGLTGGCVIVTLLLDQSRIGRDFGYLHRFAGDDCKWYGAVSRDL